MPKCIEVKPHTPGVGGEYGMLHMSYSLVNLDAYTLALVSS